MGIRLNSRRSVLTGLRQVVAVSLASAALGLSPTSGFAQDKIPVRVAYSKVITWLPMMIAKDEGLFDKNGLDVTLTAFTQIANLPGTLGKQFDFAPTTAPDMLNAVANGINLAAVAGETIETSANKAYQVLVRADGGINSPKDLAGKRIAGPGVGSVMHVALVDWVKRDGGDPSGIVGVEVPFPNMMDQLKAGRVDAVEQLEPFVGVMLGERLQVARRSAARHRRPGAVSVLDRGRGLGARPSRRHQEIRRLARRRIADHQDRREKGPRHPRQIHRAA